jgi:hypothetical protein
VNTERHFLHATTLSLIPLALAKLAPSLKVIGAPHFKQFAFWLISMFAKESPSATINPDVLLFADTFFFKKSNNPILHTVLRSLRSMINHSFSITFSFCLNGDFINGRRPFVF